MRDAKTTFEELQEAVAAEAWDRVEELWLELLEVPQVPVQELLEVRRRLWKAGEKELAITLLELLADALEERSAWEQALAALRELVRLTAKPDEALRDRLERALRESRAGSSSLGRVLDHCEVRAAKRPLEVLETAELWLDHDTGTVVEVIGQGYGRVVDINLELGNLKVDIGGVRPVSIPVGAIAKYIRILPAGSFLHRKITDPEDLAAFVDDSPGEALAELLGSLDGPADVAAIKGGLEGLLPADAWTAWWGKARKHPRIVSSGAGSRLRYSVARSADDADDALLDELGTAPPRRRLVIARRASARGDGLARTVAERLRTGLADLEATDPGLAWETAATLDTLPGGGEAAEATRKKLLASVSPTALLTGIEDRTARLQALQALHDAQPDGWAEVWAGWLLHEEHPAILSELATALTRAGEEERLDSVLEVVFRNPHQYPAQLVWAHEAMVEEHAPGALRSRLTASVLERIPDMLTRQEYGPLRARAKGLLDGGKAAIRVLLESATPEQAKRFVDRIARAPNLEPARVRLVEQAAASSAPRVMAEEAPLMVATRRAVTAKQAELKELLEVEIPRTLKGITAAAAEGDLRENFEYHMLRDRQELLSAKAAKLQRDLAQVRILEPGSTDTSSVNIGTIVSLEANGGTPLDPVTILGPWDADVERRIFANGTEIAQGLIGRVVGDQVEVDGQRARITAIEPWMGEDAKT
ncbi:MAG: GreA/GreB family elongation factor [Acidobacteria bacterium]|nr:GreA/GreB family elongation factor [Acidobacteriota bacterium]